LTRDDEFREFAAARYGALVRTGFLLAGDRGHAEDLAQSALLKTYLAWGRLRAPENAEAYARRTLIRLAGRARRRRWTGELPVGQVAESVARTSGPGLFPVPGPAVDHAVDVRRALAALPAGQREVLVLRFLDDRSEAETASLLGISAGTVKSRVSRGLASLRQAGLLAAEGDRQ
jgi:RNA polymerase sigma-70 factor (sigma-E family)